MLEAVTRYQREFEENPTLGLAHAWGELWKSQTKLASFLNAKPNDLFLRTNVTHTLNTFLLGMPLPAKSEILVGELEYGAIVNICRMRAERDELSWRILGMPQTKAALSNLSRQSLCDHIVSQIGPNTSLLLLSHVIAGTGLVLPLEEIALETRKRGVLLAVDGAYAPGAIPVDFSRFQNVDFYGCSLYKWMMGPKGTAFGWLHPLLQEKIQPVNAGWTTYDVAGPISTFGDDSKFQRAFLMSGCHDFAPFRAIQDTIAFWETYPTEKILSEMAALRTILDTRISSQLGWTSLDAKGPMNVYQLPASLQAEGPTLAKRLLEEQQIQINMVSLRGQWHMSFSPHICNTQEEIETAVNRLAKL